jgi:hypothetical protein
MNPISILQVRVASHNHFFFNRRNNFRELVDVSRLGGNQNPSSNGYSKGQLFPMD